MYQPSETERKTLRDGMVSLFMEYGYRYTMSAIDSILDEWATNKAELINIFKKHPKYVDGKFLIAFDYDFDRGYDKNTVKSFAKWVKRNCVNSDEFRSQLPDEVKTQTAREHCTWLPNDMFMFFDSDSCYCLTRLSNQFLTSENAHFVNDAFPTISAKKGQKTSRVINQICTYLGYNKHPDYNREFAKYANAMNPLKIVRHTVLSVNPLDYLTMSFGNSWGSCHTIDKSNKRGKENTYSGCYSSGTISYMLDSPSFVLYTVDSSYDGTAYYFEDKINRQMYHYGAGKLVQSRLYPQCNDGDGEAYTPYRNIVQMVMAECLGLPNLWEMKKGVSHIEDFVYSEGTHYRDYTNFESCTISFLKNHFSRDSMTIGHDPICIECGEEHDEEDCINCCHNPKSKYYVCEDCGREIDEDDVFCLGDQYYCRGCVVECKHCDRTIRRATAEEYEGFGYLCEDCASKVLVCEECGKHYFPDGTQDKGLCDTCHSKKIAESLTQYKLDTSREPKVGDMVLIRPDLDDTIYSNWHTDNYTFCVSPMLVAKGKISKVIRKASGAYRLDILGDRWNWSSGMFAGIVTEKAEGEE